MTGIVAYQKSSKDHPVHSDSGQSALLQCCFKSLFTLFAGDQHLLHQPIISLESGVAMLSTSGVTSDMRWYQRV